MNRLVSIVYDILCVYMYKLSILCVATWAPLCQPRNDILCVCVHV